MQQEKIILYQTENENISVDVYFKNETFYLTQKSMAKLFDVNSQAIAKHLKNIYEDEELDFHSTCSKMEQVQQEGNRSVTRTVNFYNLDAIIAVGYRVNSKKATRFRQWATKTLREYIIKGFVLNDDMLKNGTPFGKDYFDELLEKIKDIRASERRFYQKITDLYAASSFDYDKNSEITRDFYKKVQNKLLYAVTGNTAPEIIYNRADSHKDHMGLQTWKNSPNGKILKSDTKIAKNYLKENELKELNNIVNMYLDYAQNQASRHKLMSMQDWADRLDSFLNFNEYDLLENLGKISREVADSLADEEYNKYKVIQDKQYVSDFDEMAEKLLKNKS